MKHCAASLQQQRYLFYFTFSELSVVGLVVDKVD